MYQWTKDGATPFVKTLREIKQLKGPILIIGASGFIGYNIFSNLYRARTQTDVFGCSRNIENSWRFKKHPRENLRDADITDYDSLRKVIEEIKPKTIFNLASYGGHFHQVNPETIYRVNSVGSVLLIKALLDKEVSALVQAGSSSEYGINSDAPREDAKLEPNSDYAVSKISASYSAKYYGKCLKFPVMHLRLYSIYGPWQGRKTLIPTLISSCLEGKWPPLVSMDAAHDFVHIDDCIRAFVMAALCLSHGRGFGESVNIASGTQTTIKQLIDILKEIIFVPSEPIFGNMPNRSWDMPVWRGNPGLARRLLGWQNLTKLNDGLKTLIDWEKKIKKTA